MGTNPKTPNPLDEWISDTELRLNDTIEHGAKCRCQDDVDKIDHLIGDLVESLSLALATAQQFAIIQEQIDEIKQSN